MTFHGPRQANSQGEMFAQATLLCREEGGSERSPDKVNVLDLALPLGS